MKEAEGVPIEQQTTVDPTVGTKVLPHWLAQPYWRPLTPTFARGSHNGAIDDAHKSPNSRVSQFS
jgi:hypothetical protein